MVRTGDGAKVLVVDYGTDLNMAVYDAASNSFTASGPSTVGQVLGVAASPTGHQFAVLGTRGFAFVDSNLNVLGGPPFGGSFWGMTYTPDGTKLYVNMTISSAEQELYSVILTIDAGGTYAFDRCCSCISI